MGLEKDAGFCELIAEDTGLDYQEVVRLRGVSLGDAVNKYLPAETRLKMIKRRHYIHFDDRASSDKMVAIAVREAGLMWRGVFWQYFEGSGKGEEWYKANVPSERVMRIQDDVDTLARLRCFEKLRRGEIEAMRRMEDVRWAG